MSVRMRPTIRHRRPMRQSNPFVVPILMMGLLALLLQANWVSRNWDSMVEQSPLSTADPEFFRQLRNQVIHVYECEFCLGSGLVSKAEPGAARVMCAICNGVGYHAARRMDDSERMCMSCGGMGRLFDKDGEVRFCTRCDGRGVAAFDDDPDSGVEDREDGVEYGIED